MLTAVQLDCYVQSQKLNEDAIQVFQLGSK